MLLTTGIVALSRKISDKRAQKKEAREGLLSIGSSDVAKQAFGAHSIRSIEDSHLKRAGTQLKFDSPEDVSPTKRETSGAGRAELLDEESSSEARRAELADEKSPSELRRAELADENSSSDGPAPDQGDAMSPIASEKTAGVLSPTEALESARKSLDPPPYSATSSVYSQSTFSSATLTPSEDDSQSVSSGHATLLSGSDGPRGIRIRTKGADLKSGFAYHSDLFDFKVRPDQWERFTAQIVEATKFETKDYAQMVAAATATALTGALVTSVFVGKSMGRSLQEKKVKSGLLDTSSGRLGDVLKTWNEKEWRDVGLFVHLELSQSAMKRRNQKARSFRKPSSFYSTREDRERKQEERKFCIVVTRLDEEGLPATAIHELAEQEEMAAEMESKQPIYEIPELPGDDEMPVELPAEPVAEALADVKQSGVPQGVAELPGPTTAFEKDVEADSPTSATSPDSLRPEPLMVTADTHAALSKETA